MLLDTTVTRYFVISFCSFLVFSCSFLFFFYLSPSLFCFRGGGGGWARNARGRRVEVGSVPNALITQILFKALSVPFSITFALSGHSLNSVVYTNFLVRTVSKTWFSIVHLGRNYYIMSPLFD